MSEADVAAIVALLVPIIQAGDQTVMDEPVSLDEQIDFIRRFLGRGVFHVAVDDARGAVVGLQDVTLWLAGSRVFQHVGVISTFVPMGKQGGGIGRSLCRATFQAARALGFTKLSAAIRADNSRAVAFYLGLRFRLIGAA